MEAFKKYSKATDSNLAHCFEVAKREAIF